MSFPHLHPAVFFHLCLSLASIWLQKGMAANYGLTSSPVSPWRRGHGYLLLISTDQAHKSRLEMFDFLILTLKIFTRNEPQVKVSSPLQVPSKHPSHRYSDYILPLQVPSKHPSHRYSDFILIFKSVITIDLRYDNTRQPSLPLFATLRRPPRKNR